MRQLFSIQLYSVAATLLVVGFADAIWRDYTPFDGYGYARSSGSCPVGYIEQCVPDDYVLPHPYSQVVSSISSAGGIGVASAISEVSGFGGGGFQGGSYRSFGLTRSKCGRCPPGTVCVPSTGRCIYVFPG